MANIKVSEMTEATSFNNGDYTMIVQANQSKKISKENLFDGIEDEISTLTNQVLNITGQILWTNPNPSSDISSTTTITLSSSDYDVIEVFYIQATSGNLCYSSRFLKGNSTRMRIHTTDGANVYRGLTYLSDTSYRIDLPYSDTALANINSLAIPVYIIGYKTGLFN